MHCIGIPPKFHDDIVVLDDVHIGRTPKRFAAEKAQSNIATYFNSPRVYCPSEKTPDGLGDVEREVVSMDAVPLEEYSPSVSAPPSLKPKRKRAKKNEEKAHEWALKAFNIEKTWTGPDKWGNKQLLSAKATCKLCRNPKALWPKSESTSSSATWITCSRHLKGTHRIHDPKELENAMTASHGQQLLDVDKDRGTLRSLCQEFAPRSQQFQRCAAACARFVAWENLPIHLPSRPAFVAMMKTAEKRWPIISRRSVTRSIMSQAAAVRQQYSDEVRDILEETDVAMTADMWSSEAGDRHLTVTLHWISNDWVLHTRFLGTFEFNETHSAEAISHRLCEIRKSFGMLPRIPPGETFDQEILDDYPEYYYEQESPFDRPVITTDCGADISAGVEKRHLLDWNRCICHCLHLAVTTALQDSLLGSPISDLSKLATRFKRSSIAWQRFKDIQVEMAVAAEQRQSSTTEYESDETMDSDAEIEQEQPRPTHGRVLRVLKPVPTRWSSLYYCLERIMRLKTPITAYLQHHGNDERHRQHKKGNILFSSLSFGQTELHAFSTYLVLFVFAF